MKEFFQHCKFNAASLALIDTINNVLDLYERQGYDLSLRQLYYQLVSKNVVPNTEQSYKRVGRIVSDARLAGLIDWDMIKDRGRETLELPHWSKPGDIIRDAAAQFRIDLWEDQTIHVEVMVEKQALEGVLVPVCRELDVPFTANKGYSSSSAMYEAGKRLARAAAEGKGITVVYLGDHDPSGIDMTRDVEDRLQMFSEADVHVERVALNRNQVDEYDLPENPAKTTDSRSIDYIKRFGSSSWELDALRPDVLADLVRDAVHNYIDEDAWNAALKRQAEMKQTLMTLAAKY